MGRGENMSTEAMRAHLQDLFWAAVRAVDPRQLIRRMVQVERAQLQIIQGGTGTQVQTFPLLGRVIVIGAGKGAGLLAQELASVLGGRLAGGVVVIPRGQTAELHGVAVVHGEHPLPGPGSVAGAEHIAALLAQQHPSDVICFCLTGGASSLLVSPASGLSLDDKLAINRLLLTCGADIHAINTVRKHLSRIKGGGLARWAFPATLVSFILSDVVGDDLSTIGSGPTVPDSSTFFDALAVLEGYDLLERVPSSVLTRLRQGCAGALPETPKPGDAVFTHVHNLLIGSNRLALNAAAAAAQRLGFTTQILDEPLSGDTTEAGRDFARILRTLLQTCKAPLCVLAGGETTVRVTGQGKGGRNQEFALVVARELHRVAGWALLSVGTDGVDGPTDAAGAFVDSRSIDRATARGLDPLAALRENDTYPFFTALGDLFTPGPTGTNVMDMKIALLLPPAD
jgi:glycerate 2-kinase